tara:strand:- start:2137 stop:2532 length:396 start_codon:yes stop_codon:yes gene_type:complete
MKNNFLKLILNLYYLSLIILFILYLFPGSILGYLFYGDLGKQPNIINNPIGTSINHFFYFTYLTVLALTLRFRNKKIINSFNFLFLISLVLELMHYLIPNRAFELYDLLANSAGVVIAFTLFNLLIKIKKK